MDRYYTKTCTNIHARIEHGAAVLATKAFEEAREKVAAFVGAGSPSEIVFTQNASGAVPLLEKMEDRCVSLKTKT